MDADLTKTLDDSRAATARWLALVDGLTSQQANWRPAPDRWSIAQCLDHLVTTTGKLVPPLRQAVTEERAARRLAAGPYRYGFLSRFFLKSLAPEGAKPVKAPGAYLPSTSDVDLAAVRERFVAVQRDFEEVAASADGVDLRRVKVASPAMGLLRLPLGIWFLSTASHTLRHLRQAERVKADTRFPR